MDFTSVWYNMYMKHTKKLIINVFSFLLTANLLISSCISVLSEGTSYLAPPTGALLSIFSNNTALSEIVRNYTLTKAEKDTIAVAYMALQFTGDRYPQLIASEAFKDVYNIIIALPRKINAVLDELHRLCLTGEHQEDMLHRRKINRLMVVLSVLAELEKLMIKIENWSFDFPEDIEKTPKTIAKFIDDQLFPLCSADYWPEYKGFNLLFDKEGNFAEEASQMVSNAQRMVKIVQDDFKLTYLLPHDYIDFIQLNILREEWRDEMRNRYFRDSLRNAQRLLVNYFAFMIENGGVVRFDWNWVDTGNYWKIELKKLPCFELASEVDLKIDYRNVAVQFMNMVHSTYFMLEEFTEIWPVSTDRYFRAGSFVEAEVLVQTDPLSVCKALFAMINGFEWRNSFIELDDEKFFYDYTRAGFDLSVFLQLHREGKIKIPASGWLRDWLTIFDIMTEVNPDFVYNYERLGKMLTFYWTWYLKIQISHPEFSHKDIIEFIAEENGKYFKTTPEYLKLIISTDEYQNYLLEHFKSLVNTYVPIIYKRAAQETMPARRPSQELAFGQDLIIEGILSSVDRESLPSRILFGQNDDFVIPSVEELKRLSSEKWIDLIIDYWLYYDAPTKISLFARDITDETRVELVKIFKESRKNFPFTPEQPAKIKSLVGVVHDVRRSL